MNTVRALARLTLLLTGLLLAATHAVADVVLYDAQGKFAATLDAQGQVWSFDGKFVGLIKATVSGPAAVYSPDGRQTGWFKSGAFHDMDGLAVWAVSGRHLSITEIPPVPSVKEIAPIAPVTDIPGVAPILSNEFAAIPDSSLAFGSGSMLREQHGSAPSGFKPSNAGHQLVANSLRISEQFVTSRERQESMHHREQGHTQDMARMAAEIEAKKLANERLRRELEISSTRLAEAKRQSERLSANRETVFADPSGPIVAIEAVPELGLKKDDTLRLRPDESDGLFSVTCAVMDLSLEGKIVRRHLGFFAGASHTVESLEIIAERLRDGKLRKYSEEAYAPIAGAWGARAMKALIAHETLLNQRFFQTTESLPELSLQKGDRLAFLKVGLDGAHFQQAVVGREGALLLPVPMATVLGWLEHGQLVPVQ